MSGRMDGTQAKIAGGGATGLILLVWNKLIPWFIGLFAPEAADTWPQIDEYSAAGLTMLMVAVTDHVYGQPRAQPAVPSSAAATPPAPA